MRPLLLAILLSLCTGVSAQICLDSLIANYERQAAARDTLSLLTSVAWQYTSDRKKEGYTLALSPEGNFDEDARSETARAYRHLLGRWTFDPTNNLLTLGVDGFMGKDLVEERYRRGRDYVIEYEILGINSKALLLEDKLTGREITFAATKLDTSEDQARKRLPKPKTEPIFKLPDFNGGQ